MKIVILDGGREEETCPVLDILLHELQNRGAAVQTFRLRELHIGTCIGCFGCWLKTPGICVEADEGRKVAQAVIESDTTILLSPVTFGGYSSEIKKVQDRWIPLILPDFGIYHGEVHHKPRYSRYPRWIGIGLQSQVNDEEAHLFKVLVGRNALNFHAPSYAADVVSASDSKDSLRRKIHSLLERDDVFPLNQTIQSLMPGAVAPDGQDLGLSDRPPQALLLVGSPKVSSPSTSGVLGGHLLDQLERRGWEVSTLSLRRNLLADKGQSELTAAADRADLIIFAFPLYIDSLPFLMMKALEVMADHFRASSGENPRRVAAIVNNGFPESYQNAPAVAICRRFAIDTGITWLGGLAMGAGEALFRGHPFEETKRNGPPVFHVQQALDLAASAMAHGQPIPAEAIKLISRSPIPMVPFRLWRRMFIPIANQHWRRLAAEREVGPEAMLAQPLSD